MNISLLEPLGIDGRVLESFAHEMEGRGHTFNWYDKKATGVEELIERSRGNEIIMIAHTPYPREVIEANKQIRLIAVAFTSTDHVDLAACKERGIVVTNCTGQSDQAVAEFVIGLALAQLRTISSGDSVTRRGGSNTGLVGREIADRRVGIIGYGRIGSKTAALFSAFGAEVVAYSRTPKNVPGVTFLSLDELMSTSDIISLHLPYNKETHHLIGQRELSLMKEGALLINCAEGLIVDNAALACALTNKKIKAALDVFDTEPPLKEAYPLLKSPHTLLSPHVAYRTEETMNRRAAIEFENVRAFLDGRAQNVVVL